MRWSLSSFLLFFGRSLLSAIFFADRALHFAFFLAYISLRYFVAHHHHRHHPLSLSLSLSCFRYVELPHKVTYPLVTVVTSSTMGPRDATSLEMWIGGDGGNKASGPHKWQQPPSTVKCGTLVGASNKYPVLSSKCSGSGKGLFLRPVDGASLSMVVTEVRVEVPVVKEVIREVIKEGTLLRVRGMDELRLACAREL